MKHANINKSLYSWSAQNHINPIKIIDAKGIYIFDDEGNKYYDLSSQLVNVNIGHKNLKVIEAMKQQADALPYSAPFYNNEKRDEAADLIVDIAPDNMSKVFFTNGGAEANEHAIRVAKQYTNRNKILSGYYGYHGSTYGASSMSGDPRRFYTENPPAPGFIKFMNPYLYRSSFKFNSEEEATEIYLNYLEEKIILENPDNIAAIWFEGIVGSNGILIPPKNYYKGVRKLCDKYGILLVIDDVMAGFGRTGEWFSSENFGFKPDMITFAKGVTSGYFPLGGIIVSKEIADYFNEHKLMTGLTYSGHPIGCATAIANIKVMKELKVVENSRILGKYMKQKLEDLKGKHDSIGDVRSVGLFGIIEFVKDRKTKERMAPYGKDPEGTMRKIKAQLFKNGLASFGRESLITVAPPLIINRDELDDIFIRLDKVCSFADEMISK